jgi:hypothetical protein
MLRVGDLPQCSSLGEASIIAIHRTGRYRRHLRRDDLHPRLPALPVSDAIAEIRRCSGTQLDPDIVLAFLACQSKIVMPGDVRAALG